MAQAPVEKYIPPANGWRTFLTVWATQSVSVFGSALTQFALNIWLLTTAYPLDSQKSQLAWALSALNLAFAIPIVFGAPIAGAFADRHDHKRIMITMDTISGFVSLLTMLLIWTQLLNIYILIGIAAVNATIMAFHGAAFDTSYAMLVPEEKLARANGMMQTIWSLSGILAPAVAAAIISVPGLVRQGKLPGLFSPLGLIADGAALAIGIDAVSFFLAALVPLFLFIPSPKRDDLQSATGDKKSLWSDVGEGFRYIWYRRSFLWLLGTFTVANFISGIAGVAQTLIVRFQLQPSWESLGYSIQAALAVIGTLTAIGGVAGGVFISAWGGLKKRRVIGVLIPMIISGIGIIILGLSRHFYLAAGAVALSSGMIPIMNSHSQTIWQTQTPREKQGRVFSVRRLIAQISWPVSSFLAGALSAAFAPGMVMLVFGSILIVWCLVGLFNPYLMRVEDKEWIEAQAAVYERQESQRQLSLKD